MVGANLKAETIASMDKRTAIETEMNLIIDRLCQPGGPGLSGNLVDSKVLFSSLSSTLFFFLSWAEILVDLCYPKASRSGCNDADYSSRRSNKNNEQRETIMLPGCDYNHWLIVMEFPKDPAPTREQMIETYLNTLATVLGRYHSSKNFG